MPDAARKAGEILADFHATHCLWMAYGHLLRDEAEAALRWFDRLDGAASDPDAAYHRGLALLALERWSEAEQAFAIAAGGDEPWHQAGQAGLGEVVRRRAGSPFDPATSPAPMPPALFAGAVWRKAHALIYNGHASQALSALEQCLRANPDHPELLGLAGVCHVELGAFAAALPPLRRATALIPEAVWPWAHLAMALGGVGQQGDAVAAARHAVMVEPRQAWPHQLLAQHLEMAGHLSEARAEYAEALALDPSNAYARQRWEMLSPAGTGR